MKTATQVGSKLAATLSVDDVVRIENLVQQVDSKAAVLEAAMASSGGIELREETEDGIILLLAEIQDAAKGIGRLITARHVTHDAAAPIGGAR